MTTLEIYKAQYEEEKSRTEPPGIRHEWSNSILKNFTEGLREMLEKEKEKNGL